VLLGGVGLGVGGVAGCGGGGPAGVVRIAAGEPGGFYVEFADLLAAQLSDAAPDLDVRVVTTGGSADNLARLSAHRADLGLVLADVATAAVTGSAPFRRPAAIRAIGRVYENYMQLVVLRDSPIRTVADLAGRRISLGANGSGAAIFGDRLLAATGTTTVVDHRPLTEAVTELAAGRIDALLWSGGVPTPALATLSERHPIRLVPLADALPALRAAHGTAYDRVLVPDGGYGQPSGLDTIGVPNLLVCNGNLAEDLVSTVAEVLVHRAPRLVPRQAVGTQYLDQRSLIVTGAVPLHPGAATAYRALRD
jgi:uncharacterized protein